MDSNGGEAKEYGQLEGSYGTRKRHVDNCANDGNEGEVYGELERLRGIVDVIEGDRNKSCLKLSLNNSAMSTIFGLVFVVIVLVTIYAFANLYRALVKRFYPIDN